LQITQLPTRSVIISKSYYSFSPQLIYLKRSLFMNPQSTIFGTKRGLDFTAPLHERGKLFLHTVEHMYTNQNIHSSIPIQFKLHIIILNPTGNMVSITHDLFWLQQNYIRSSFRGGGCHQPHALNTVVCLWHFRILSRDKGMEY